MWSIKPLKSFVQALVSPLVSDAVEVAVGHVELHDNHPCPEAQHQHRQLDVVL